MRSLENDLLVAKRSLGAAQELEESLQNMNKNAKNIHVLKKKLQNDALDAETRLRAAKTEQQKQNLIIGLKMILPTLAIRLIIFSDFSSWFIILFIGAILSIIPKENDWSYFCNAAIIVEFLIISFKWLSFGGFLCVMIILIASLYELGESIFKRVH